VDLLNVQLQQRVHERSRELAAALQKLGQTDESWNARKLEPGSVIGDRARVVRLLGEGGMGEVYLCEDLLTGQRVALKVVRSGNEVDQKTLQRMLGEAAAAASVAHPGVVKTLHVDVSADGSLYLLTEYVSGETLSSRIRRCVLSPGEAARLGQVLAAALAAAHATGVVHRDIKPHNIMLTSTPPGVKLLDFGISKTAEPVWNSTVTATGQLLGSPAYMAPEQFKDSSTVTAACDVYSTGLVIFEAVAGQRPFSFDDVLQAMAAHTLEEPPFLADVVQSVPRAMSDLVAACLVKDPNKRPTAAELSERLGRIADELGAPEATDFAPPASLVMPASIGRSRTRGA
jgi:serine/threonine-protein kinase